MKDINQLKGKEILFGMEINDIVYGKEKVEEKVLIDLINSPSLQRLKDVSQLGMPEKYYNKKNFSRFEHSLGVFILLKRLGANLEEQIAGLTHDVSHPAFSHVIDWISGDPTKENHQDENHFEVMSKSDIPKILEKYNFDYKFISNHENFPLLEKNAPSLCADRIDYSLREWVTDKNKEVSLIYKNLFVKDNQIIFQNKNIAESFAKIYSTLQTNSWGCDESRSRYIILSDALKEGLKEKLFCLDDLNKTETFLLNKLENSNNKFILEKLNLLKNGFEMISDNSGIELLTKFRYIDPEVSVNGHYKNLSSLSKNYFNFLEIQKENFKTPSKVRIISK